MVSQQTRIVIAGGGIGGLTAAIALQRKGFPVQVLEQSAEYLPLGAGITLQMNAMQALRHIGMSDVAEAAGNRLNLLAIRFADGKLVASEDMQSPAAEFGVPFLAIHRAQLHDVLLQAMRPAEVERAFRVVECTESGDGVAAVAEDGRRAEGDILIGADGLHSRIRGHLWGDEAPRYSGYTSWRAVTHNGGRVPTDEGSESWGEKSVFGLIPLADDRLYWFATQQAAADGSDPADPRDVLLPIFGNWHDPIRSVVEDTDPQSIIRTDIRDRPTRFPWGQGRMTLLGDAAHPMTPNLGQGGGQAIEDAVVLAEFLARHESIEDGLRGYERRRHPRTKHIVQTSRRMSAMAHGGTALMRFARRCVFPHIPRGVHRRMVRKIFQFEV